MKKLISIENLAEGMFLEADVVVEERDGEQQRFLAPRDSVSTGGQSKRARLTGKMHEKIEAQGGIKISSEGLVERLRQTGLTMVSIDTDKGSDLPSDVKPLTDPTRKPPLKVVSFISMRRSSELPKSAARPHRHSRLPWTTWPLVRESTSRRSTRPAS